MKRRERLNVEGISNIMVEWVVYASSDMILLIFLNL